MASRNAGRPFRSIEGLAYRGVRIENLYGDTPFALAGAHIATVPYAVLLKMIQHPLTDVGIERFLADWKKVSG